MPVTLKSKTTQENAKSLMFAIDAAKDWMSSDEYVNWCNAAMNAFKYASVKRRSRELRRMDRELCYNVATMRVFACLCRQLNRKCKDLGFHAWQIKIITEYFKQLFARRRRREWTKLKVKVVNV